VRLSSQIEATTAETKNKKQNDKMKLKEIFAKLDMEKLIESFELTETRNDKEIPTVRGWMMDEMERRNPEAFEAWLNGDPSIPARKYFLAA
jgi:hypothetical protein